MATDTQSNNDTSDEAASKDPEQIEAEIEATREELSQTVDELSQKLDVKSQAQRRVDDVKSQAQRRVQDVKQRAKVTAEDPQARSEALKSAAPVLAGVAGVALALGVLRRLFR